MYMYLHVYVYSIFFYSVVLVVSSRLHHPVESIQKLYKLQKESEQQPNSPYWIPSPHIFYYHVLIHDVLDGSHKQYVCSVPLITQV